MTTIQPYCTALAKKCIFIPRFILRQSLLAFLCVIAPISVIHAAAVALPTSPPVNPTPATILVLGDSLSSAHGITPATGWVALLQRRLTTQGYPYKVINASVSGETSGGGLSRVSPLLQTYKPQLLIIELGANDGLRGYPIKILRHNLTAIVEYSKHYGAQAVLVAVQIPHNYGARYTSLLQQTFTSLSTGFGIPLVPSLLGDIPLYPELMQDDQLHPNAKAQPQILENVWPTLQPLLQPSSANKQLSN